MSYKMQEISDPSARQANVDAGKAFLERLGIDVEGLTETDIDQYAKDFNSLAEFRNLTGDELSNFVAEHPHIGELQEIANDKLEELGIDYNSIDTATYMAYFDAYCSNPDYTAEQVVAYADSYSYLTELGIDTKDLSADDYVAYADAIANMDKYETTVKSYMEATDSAERSAMESSVPNLDLMVEIQEAVNEKDAIDAAELRAEVADVMPEVEAQMMALYGITEQDIENYQNGVVHSNQSDIDSYLEANPELADYLDTMAELNTCATVEELEAARDEIARDYILDMCIDEYCEEAGVDRADYDKFVKDLEDIHVPDAGKDIMKSEHPELAEIYGEIHDVKAELDGKTFDELSEYMPELELDEVDAAELSESEIDAEYERLLEMANDTINGKYGNGDERKEALGEDFEAVQHMTNQILNGEEPTLPDDYNISVKDRTEKAIEEKQLNQDMEDLYQSMPDYMSLSGFDDDSFNDRLNELGISQEQFAEYATSAHMNEYDVELEDGESLTFEQLTVKTAEDYQKSLQDGLSKEEMEKLTDQASDYASAEEFAAALEEAGIKDEYVQQARSDNTNLQNEYISDDNVISEMRRQDEVKDAEEEQCEM